MDVDVARSFTSVVDRHLSRGLIVTTSSFTSDAADWLRSPQSRVKGVDGAGLPQFLALSCRLNPNQ